MTDKQQSQTPKPKDAKETGSSRSRQGQGLRSEQLEGTGNVFKQLFATLEAEHQKLQQLEQRRIKLIEEMKTLREMLQKENLRLRQSTASATSRKSILRKDASKNSSQWRTRP